MSQASISDYSIGNNNNSSSNNNIISISIKTLQTMVMIIRRSLDTHQNRGLGCPWTMTTTEMTTSLSEEPVTKQALIPERNPQEIIRLGGSISLSDLLML